jgi:hypothetical protein
METVIAGALGIAAYFIFMRWYYVKYFKKRKDGQSSNSRSHGDRA